jgi:hypothetical protein
MLDPSKRFAVVELGQRLLPSERTILHGSLRAAIRSRQEPHVLGRILANCVRTVALRNAEVGSNVFVACIPKASVSFTADRFTVAYRRLLPDVASALYLPGEDHITDSPERTYYDLVVSGPAWPGRAIGVESVTLGRGRLPDRV